MLIGGAVLAVAGLISLIFGFIRNSDKMAVAADMLKGGSGGPGTVFIVIGLIAIVAGAVLAYLAFKNKKK